LTRFQRLLNMKRLKIKKLVVGLILFVSITVNLFLYNHLFGYGAIAEKILKSPQYNKIYDIAKVTLKNIVDIPYIIYWFAPEDHIPIYNLVISQEDIKKLNDNLPAEGFQFKGKRAKVPAKFTYNGKEYKVKASYRGDWANHWAFKQKSWQVDFSENYFGGFSSIGLIVSKDRGFFAEELSNYRAKKLGVKTPESKFIVLKINGERAGVYFQIENWGKDFLERSDLSGDANFYGENADAPLFDSVFYWKQYAADPNLIYADYSQLDKLVRLVKDAPEEQFNKEIADLVDMDNFYAWNIHSMLAGSTHQDGTHNIRLYFDNTIGKFKFIAWDVGLEKIDKIRTYEKNKPGIDFINYTPIVAKILKNDNFLKERNRLLWQYVSDSGNLDDDIKHYDKLAKTYRYALYQDFNKRITNWALDKNIAESRRLVEYNFNYIKDLFSSAEFKEKAVLGNGGTVKIGLAIRSYSPLALEDIKLSGATGKEDFIVYYDSNNNGKKDYADKKIGYLNYSENGEYYFKPDNGDKILFETKRMWFKNNNPEFVVLKEIEGEELQETTHYIFIAPKNSAGNSSLLNFSIKTILNNYYTKEDLTAL